MPNTTESIIDAFYKQALTVNTTTNSTEVLNRLLADNFQSENGQEIKSKAILVAQIPYFWKMIPNLKWEPREVLSQGNKVVVRSVATGSPAGEFMGLSLDGTKSFTMDTIDIHTIENGLIVHVYHVEDWATALKQLKA